MKKFLLAAFKITVPQALLIVFFSALKYVLSRYHLGDKIQKPFIWTCIGAVVLLVLATCIIGIVQNRGESYREWRIKPEKSIMKKLMVAISVWGLAIPAMLLYALLLYMFAPDSVFMCIALYAGIVLNNSMKFFAKDTAPN